ncbi:AMP-binding protein [Schaalia sp. ZJ405]|uniref:AMP-binding protein n=1 Tax=Schaalia sp. ZJ405 TaxID=2709403 RepID=UPI0013EAE75F|nr:AMP-binding protein [Schaalia sp. ZJ405]QPK81569.1 AMP-binding protein [Schaalia sp. ZJ405]
MSTPRVLVVPGGTSIGAVALANASIHKLVELHEERQRDPHHPAPRTIVAIRPPAQVPAATLRGSAVSLDEAFPADRYPYLAQRLEDPSFLDGVDLVLPTSGSTTGQPRLVGLSIDSLIAAHHATNAVLDGPGRWILALPTHHVAGAMVLLRCALSATNPLVIDTMNGFHPEHLLPAIRTITEDPSTPGYLSLVPTQLEVCLNSGDEVVSALASLNAILVGGAASDPSLLDRAREAGLAIHTTYGMTETCGGCVYNGFPLPGTIIRSVDHEGSDRLAIAGPQLLTKYLDGDTPFFEEAGKTWLLSADLGTIHASGQVTIHGRVDDIITSGGLSIHPEPIRAAIAPMDEVSDVHIIGLPDKRWGEVVTALVVPSYFPETEEQMAQLGHAIRDFAGSRVGRVQAPRRVLLFDELPVLDSGKLDRNAAKRAAEDFQNPMREWRR